MPFFSPFSRIDYVIAGALAAILDHANEGPHSKNDAVESWMESGFLTASENTKLVLVKTSYP